MQPIFDPFPPTSQRRSASISNRSHPSPISPASSLKKPRIDSLSKFDAHKTLAGSLSTSSRAQSTHTFFGKLPSSLRPSPKVPTLSTIVDESPGKEGLSAEQASQKYARLLGSFERSELASVPRVYFLGLNAQKVVPNAKAENNGFDEQGVYKVVPHDHLAYRYEIFGVIGTGTFSQVVSAFDHKEHRRVAIKIIKSLPRYYEQSLKEIEILSGIKRAYGASSFSVELLEHFMFRNHRMMAFPLMHASLYAHLEQRGFKGLQQKQVLNIAHQILCALQQIHRSGLVHCDLKPENIMYVTPEMDRVRLIDFGNALQVTKKLHSYVQSRFYRAPEVILGYKYNTAVDMWSFGCIVVELATGKPPFRGEDTHQQLLSIMEYKDYPPGDFVAQAPKKREFFFSYNQAIIKPDSKGNVKVPSSKSVRGILKDHAGLWDLVEKSLEWAPAKRITAGQALQHPVFGKHSDGTPPGSKGRHIDRKVPPGHKKCASANGHSKARLGRPLKP